VRAPREPPLDPRPRWGEVGIHGVARVREWDVVVSAEAGPAGTTASFVVLADGRVVAEEGPEDVTAFVDAVGAAALELPYRAEAVHRGDGGWTVAARKIRVVELPGISGDDLEFTLTDAGPQLLVDGLPSAADVGVLKRLLGGRAGHVSGMRLAGDAFEVEAIRL
jgi:hypothetical protein